jgi:G3E family GTPase
MCCTVRKDFIEAIDRLLASGKKIDNIIIECSGMSEPLPIAQSFLMNDMEGRVKLDSIICVVDADNFTGKITSATDTALDQLEFADFIIMNKSDLVSLEQMDFLETVIRKVNFGAPIYRTSQAITPIKLLLDTTRIGDDDEEKMRKTPDEHTHSETMSTYTYRGGFAFDTRMLDIFFQSLPYEIYRVKGFVHLKEKPGMRYILQKAGARVSLAPDPTWKGEDIENIIVFIGEDINPFLLNVELAKCR